MSDNLSYSIGSPDSSTEMLAIAERIAKQKRLGTDPVKHVDGSGKPLPGSALDILTRLRERSMDSEALLTQPPGKWHIRGLIKEGQFGLMLGKWKAGKSLAFHLALVSSVTASFFTAGGSSPLSLASFLAVTFAVKPSARSPSTMRSTSFESVRSGRLAKLSEAANTSANSSREKPCSVRR